MPVDFDACLKALAATPLTTFPRIPFTETPETFEALSVLGWDLVQTHLLKTVPRSSPRLGDYVGKGDHTVEAVVWSPEEATVWINPKRTQGFANVPHPSETFTSAAIR